MRHHTCTACQTRIPTGSAVLRGNGHELLTFHRDCFTLTRALPQVFAFACEPARA